MHSQQFETNVEESLIGCPFGEKLNFFMNFKVLVTVILVLDQNAPLKQTLQEIIYYFCPTARFSAQ